MHLAVAAAKLGHSVQILTSPTHRRQHPVLKRVEDLLTEDRQSRKKADIYVGKGDAFYRNDNWETVRRLNGFKVCLCNSDQCFRESSVPYRRHHGGAVQSRCDLYMPANHSTNLLVSFQNVIPVAHPIDPRLYELLWSMGLYDAYVDDDVEKIRSAFDVKEDRRLGFMGSPSPVKFRQSVSNLFPPWVDFSWRRTASALTYVNWVLRRRGCLDLRGNGDKSIRFTEAALLGRTIVATKYRSEYRPDLEHGQNCVLYEMPDHIRYNRLKWLAIATRATEDYKIGWSMRAQILKIIKAATS